MRINKYLALHAGLSRRAADQAVTEGRVLVNGHQAALGDEVASSDQVILDGSEITSETELQTIMLNKPVGFVCSRDGQGSRTVYDLLPEALHGLKPVGRLDKDSSGLLLMTNDGDLAHGLTHPSKQKIKTYEVELDRALEPKDAEAIEEGVELEDGQSRLQLKPMDARRQNWQIAMHEGRNRQIRRTFAACSYRVEKLHRTTFGAFSLEQLKSGKYRSV